jgi:CRP-like cAMP-binding protein
VITRAIGKERTVIVDTLVFDVVVGDTLMLCSDGLHQYTKDAAELAGLLGAEDVENIPARLVALANERGGSDNVTAVVARGQASEADYASAQRATDVRANLETLKRIDLMQDLGMAEVVRLNQIFQEVHYPAGSVIVQEGDTSDGLFVIVQGSAEVLRGDRRVATLPAGTHFGEMSLLSSKPRSATVRALENARTLFVDRARLYGFLQQDGMLAAKVFWKLAKTLAKRLDESNEKQDQLSQALAAATAQRPSGYYTR